MSRHLSAAGRRRSWGAVAPIAVAAAILAGAAMPRGPLVLAIRSLDRRGGLASRRGHRGYAAVSCLFRGLHDRVARDAAAAVGSRPATIVDVGSGPGAVLEKLRGRAPTAVLLGIEPSGEMRWMAGDRGIVTWDGRAECLPLADASVDLVLSTLSSHHWDDAGAAFAEIRRVLRPDGEARIYDVRCAGFGPEEVRRSAASAGLAPGEVHRRISDERLVGLRPYSVITIRPAHGADGDATTDRPAIGSPGRLASAEPAAATRSPSARDRAIDQPPASAISQMPGSTGGIAAAARSASS